MENFNNTQTPEPQDVQMPEVSKGPNKIAIILAVIILVILGAGYAWYYVQGQAMLLVKDMNLQWTQQNANFKIFGSFDYEISNINVDSDPTGFITEMPFDYFKLSGTSEYQAVGEDFAGTADLKLTMQDNTVDLPVTYLKKNNKSYLLPPMEGIQELFGNFFGQMVLGVKEFDQDNIINIDTETEEYWIEFDWPETTKAGTEVSIEEFNNLSNEIITELKDKKVFQIKDLHQTVDTVDGKLKAIQFNIPKDKVEVLIMTTFDIIAEQRSDPDNKQVAIDNFNKFKAERPDQWQQLQDYTSAVNMILWINTKDKNIQGIDVTIENFIYEYGPGSATLDLSVSYLIVSAQPITISVPTNTMSFEEIFGQMMGGMMPSGSMNNYNMDMETDTDGEEAYNGYNPMGEGLLGDDPEPEIVSDIDYNKSYFERTCEYYEGTWVAMGMQDESVCSAISDWVICGDTVGGNTEGCSWDFTANACLAGSLDHCLCANGEKVYPRGELLSPCPL